MESRLRAKIPHETCSQLNPCDSHYKNSPKNECIHQTIKISNEPFHFSFSILTASVNSVAWTEATKRRFGCLRESHAKFESAKLGPSHQKCPRQEGGPAIPEGTLFPSFIVITGTSPLNCKLSRCKKPPSPFVS